MYMCQRHSPHRVPPLACSSTGSSARPLTGRLQVQILPRQLSCAPDRVAQLDQSVGLRIRRLGVRLPPWSVREPSCSSPWVVVQLVAHRTLIPRVQVRILPAQLGGPWPLTMIRGVSETASRLPVEQETTGSTPVRPAFISAHGTVAPIGRAPGLQPGG